MNVHNPIRLLPGENIFIRITEKVQALIEVWLSGQLIITNFRIIFQVEKSDDVKIPLMSIETIKRKALNPDLHQLKLRLKDFRVLLINIEGAIIERTFNFLTQWQNLDAVSQLFAFDFRFPVSKPLNGWYLYDPSAEYERMGIPSSNWRVTNINSEYLLCSTYPSRLCVPADISGQELLMASKFRSGGRIPVLVWKSPKKSATLSRCSQPLTGLTGSRCVEDEKLVQLIAKSTPSGKLLVFDARPKANAMANSMKGGGYENTVYYENCNVMWGNLPNIHAVYDSWKNMRTLLCQQSQDEFRWFSSLESTQWFANVHTILLGVNKIVETMEQDVSVLIHCTDGWDRTPTLASLVQLLMDPQCRTLRGFIVLIEKDWLSFGHRFGERCGHMENRKTPSTKKSAKQPTNYSPVFMLFIDCVFQLTQQFPLCFEFNNHFLTTLLDAVYSCQYGTFLCNSEKERKDKELRTKTISLWTFINSNVQPFLNPLYQTTMNGILHPIVHMKDLVFWDKFYLKKFGKKQVASRFLGKGFIEAVTDLVQEKDERIRQLEQALAELQGKEQVSEPELFARSIVDDILNVMFTEYIFAGDHVMSTSPIRRAESITDFRTSRDDDIESPFTIPQPSKGIKIKSHTMWQRPVMDLPKSPTKSPTARSPQGIMIRNRPRGDADNFGGSFRPVLPPKWVPDACVDKCKSCDQEFTSFRRKHHCRHCGEIFCSGCCSQKRRIEKYGFTQAQKVCNKCCTILDAMNSHFEPRSRTISQ